MFVFQPVEGAGKSELYTLSSVRGDVLQIRASNECGAGPGIGLSVGIDKHLLVKSDINIFWVNGNAGSFRVALGYKRNGVWAPAGYVGISTFFGDRTEILLEDGSRPVSPVFALGLQLSPLRFEREKGFVSVLEMGYGMGHYKGKNLEISLLSVGIKF